MSKGLETLREIGEEVIRVNCLAGWIAETVKEAYGKRFDGIKKELEDYSEIKEIAEHYHFDDLAKDTHMTTTDEKYLRLFNAAIPSIQADYRKARAFEIIKKKSYLNLDNIRNASNYDTYLNRVFKLGDLERRFLEEGESVDWLATREEFYCLKEALK